MPEAHKITLRIGDYEFSAEGAEKLVESQFSRFLEVISRASTSQAPPAKSPQSPPPGDNGSPLPADLLRRVYTVEDENVSLRLLPRTECRDADAILLLLYGYRQQGETDVLSVRIKDSARQSGLNFQRIDKALLPNQEYVTEGGAKKGKRYGLNNRGINRAEEIIREMQ